MEKDGIYINILMEFYFQVVLGDAGRLLDSIQNIFLSQWKKYGGTSLHTMKGTGKNEITHIHSI